MHLHIKIITSMCKLKERNELGQFPAWLVGLEKYQVRLILSVHGCSLLTQVCLYLANLILLTYGKNQHMSEDPFAACTQTWRTVGSGHITFGQALRKQERNWKDFAWARTLLEKNEITQIHTKIIYFQSSAWHMRICP